MKEIPLTRGYVALVDDADYDWLSAFKWRAKVYKTGRVYAARGGNGATILMHREIAKAPPDVLVDHRIGIGLDNQRANLRTCNRLQNAWNRRSRNAASFKGVERCGNRFRAEICKDYRRVKLGHYGTAIEAALAYDTAAKLMFGEFARLNFPNGHPTPPVIGQNDSGGVSCVGEINPS